nr:hypothetical protein [Catenulispora pinisilvae]
MREDEGTGKATEADGAAYEVADQANDVGAAADPAVKAAAEAAKAARRDWKRPAAWGLLTPDADVVRVTRAGENMACVVLATVVDHWSGSASYLLTPPMIAEAVAMIESVLRDPAVRHRTYIALRLLGEADAVVAFVDEADFLADAEDRHVAALLAEGRRGRQENPDGTTTLWRPTGPTELELVRASGSKAWPPRLEDQPIFYPVLTEQYATVIARDWNVPNSGSGYVTRFHVATPTARRYWTRTAGGPEHLELWVPAAELDALNAAIVGEIEVVAEFSG